MYVDFILHAIPDSGRKKAQLKRRTRSRAWCIACWNIKWNMKRSAWTNTRKSTKNNKSSISKRKSRRSAFNSSPRSATQGWKEAVSWARRRASSIENARFAFNHWRKIGWFFIPRAGSEWTNAPDDHVRGVCRKMVSENALLDPLLFFVLPEIIYEFAKWFRSVLFKFFFDKNIIEVNFILRCVYIFTPFFQAFHF